MGEQYYNYIKFFDGSRVSQIAKVDNATVQKVQKQLAPGQDSDSSGQEQQDTTSNIELLRAYEETVQRWKANICIPEYYERQIGEDGDVYTSLDWGYTIDYPPTNPPRITPKQRYTFKDDEIYVSAALKSEETNIRNGRQDFVVEVGANHNESFRDPYTNEILHELTVRVVQSNHMDRRSDRALTIAECTQDNKTRAIEYCILRGVDSGESFLHVGNLGFSSRDTFEKKAEELLSEPHALALVNFMDRLIIPQATPTTPQPGQRPTPELSAPRPLPAPRRRPGR